MKKLLFTLAGASLLFTSCVKEPEACINLSPTGEIEVFDVLTMTSCSENAETLEWTVEGSASFFFAVNEEYIGESATHSWDMPGTYTIELNAISKNEKKEDKTSTTVTVNDICYECVDTGGWTVTECGSYYFTADEFESEVDYWRNLGYTCTKK